MFTDWVPYALVATGVVGLFLIQSSFHAGPITASQAAITIIDPIVSVVIGIYLFHDHLDTAGWRLPVEVVAIVVVVVGVMVLSHVAAGGRGQGRVGQGRQAGPPGPTPPGDRTALSRAGSGTAEHRAHRLVEVGVGKVKPDRLELAGQDPLAGQHHVGGHLGPEDELEGGGRHGQERRPVEGGARAPWPARRRWPGAGRWR